MNSFELELTKLAMAMLGVYWIAVTRILYTLKADADNKITMYLPVINFLVLGGRVGLGIIYWGLIVSVYFGLPFFFPGNEPVIFWARIAIVVFFFLLFWVRVATFCQKPLYLAFFQFVPLANLWALWKIGSSDKRSAQKKYEERIARLENQLKRNEISQEEFIKLYKKALGGEETKNY